MRGDPLTVMRRARPDDAARAARLVADALAEHGIAFEPDGRDADVRLFGARADHDDLVAIAEGSAVVTGIVSVGPHGGAGVAWVSKLFVAREARRRGVGRALMNAAHDAARARGFREVGLRTRPIFRDAVRLYEALGYARRDDPRAPGGDLVLWRAL